MASNVEENPGPTIDDVVDPSKIVCADFGHGKLDKMLLDNV